MPRQFAPISIEALKTKIDAVMGEGGVHALIEKLAGDIKVSFDLENVSAKAFGPKTVMGYHTEPNGLTYCGFAAGGDWEHPVYFMVYWDGKKLRGYVPTEGNPWNRMSNTAYGNDDAGDLKDAKKRWSDKFKGAEGIGAGDLAFDAEAIRRDFLARILPAGKKDTKSGERDKAT
jgi:hypothetical protein